MGGAVGRIVDRALTSRPIYLVGFLAADVTASVLLILLGRRLNR